MEILPLKNYQIDPNKILSEIEIFSNLSSPETHVLSEHMDLIKINKHELLFEENAHIDYIYFVYSGRLVAYQNKLNQDFKILGMISRGDSVGEMSLISSRKTVANVKATRQSLLIRLPKAQIEEVINSQPAVARSLAEIILNRMERLIKKSQNENILRTNINTIAVIGAGDFCLTEPFCKKFTEEHLKKHQVMQVTADDLKNLTNEPNWELHASSHLSQLEADHDYLIFDCRSDKTPYSEYLVSNADMILLVGDASAHHLQSPLEKYLSATQDANDFTEKNLVLVHPSIDKPFQNTALWFDHRELTDVYHVSLENEFSMRSLVRMITGHAITLVLSGGGACGYAHIGVIQALKKNGIEIDAISGVSSGAIIAALYALGFDDQKMLTKLKSLVKNMKSSLFSLQLPVSSLFKPKHLEELIHTLVGDAKIEDLHCKFFSLACNIASGEDTIFDRGSLSDAVVASNSLPGLCSPKVINNQPYVDGGVSNTMPGDVMKKKYGGTTIVVDISRKRGIELDLPEDKFPSSLNILLRALNPFKKNYKIPFMHEIVTRSVILANKRKLEEVKQLADYVINPDLSHIGPMDHDRIDEITAIGHKEAMKVLKK